MIVATFNINGINRRLPVLLRWLEERRPNIVCLQELKSPDDRFPIAAIETAGYGAVWQGQRTWNGVAILARGRQPIATRRALPGNARDAQSRYIEAAIAGLLIGCLYVPNGNPAPGPKFTYKQQWLRRLTAHAGSLAGLDVPVILAGDFNIIPEEVDVYAPERWRDDALFRPEVRTAHRKLVAQGWTDALRQLEPEKPVYTFWKYYRNAFARDAGLRIDHIVLSPSVAARLSAGGVDRHVRGWTDASDHAPAWIRLKRQARQAGR